MKVQTAHGHEPDEVGAGAGDASASCITNKKRATNASYWREGVKSKYYCSDHFGSMFQVLGSSALSSRNVQGANPHSEERRSRRAAVQTCEHSSSRARGGRRALNKVKSNMLDRTNIERMLINFTDMYVGCPRRQPVASSSGHPLPRRAARAAVPPRVHGV